jgi:hypothetical protein
LAREIGRRREKGRGKGKGKWWDPRLEGDLEDLQEWRLRREIWRGTQNGGSFGGSAGDDFFHQTSKFWREAPMEALA